jgi:hypothetical protein
VGGLLRQHMGRAVAEVGDVLRDPMIATCGIEAVSNARSATSSMAIARNRLVAAPRSKVGISMHLAYQGRTTFSSSMVLISASVP